MTLSNAREAAEDARQMIIGIDVGGTFTDLAALLADGTVITSKVLSTSDDCARGMLNALAAANIGGDQVASIAHGTTVVTNLLLERRGALVTLCATEGFTDLLELRRQERAALYDLTRHHPRPLVEGTDVLPVAERIAPQGVIRPLDDATIADVVTKVLERSPATVAIALLHAYGNPVHEQRLADALREEISRRGESIGVVTSHEVLPEIREYERMATTVAEAYARPAVQRYLTAFTETLAVHGYPEPRVMTSAGGTLTAEMAAEHAAALALSGPAGGVTGAAAVSRALGIPCALTIDIGGTSADVGFIEDGEPLVERGGNVAGVPIALPRVLVEAVAAGGGSIAWLDDGGALRAGPESAGAVPGPAAYGSGGERPTVTDAHVVLGAIATGGWSGGMQISRELAERAIARIAHPLGVSLERAARALISTADATMARALRRISVERGVDPRAVPLIAFGGGGPLHACGLAEHLGMTRVIVPPYAGVLSAVGLALAPERRESLVSCMITAGACSDEAMRGLLRRTFVGLSGLGSGLEARWYLRARYVGQGYELDVPVESDDTVTGVVARFIARHADRAGFTLERDVEFISLRTTLSGRPGTINWNNSVVDGPMRGRSVKTLADATMLVANGWHARPLHIGGWMLELDR